MKDHYLKVIRPVIKSYDLPPDIVKGLKKYCPEYNVGNGKYQILAWTSVWDESFSQTFLNSETMRFQIHMSPDLETLTVSEFGHLPKKLSIGLKSATSDII